jgi:hypothetical protein
MAIINDITEVMHRIRAKLYPNYLHGIEGKYIARTQAEATYQLADGFAITNDYFSLHPKIGGTFDKPTDPIDPAKHKIAFSFRPAPAPSPPK